MKQKSEKDIEKFFVATVKTMGGRSFKWTSPQNRGVPDRIALFPGGVVIFVELKRPGGKLTALQAKLKRECFDAMDIPYIVLDSFDAVRTFKENILLAIESTEEK